MLRNGLELGMGGGLTESGSEVAAAAASRQCCELLVEEADLIRKVHPQLAAAAAAQGEERREGVVRKNRRNLGCHGQGELLQGGGWARYPRGNFTYAEQRGRARTS